MHQLEWVLDILSDISEFAGANNLPKIQAVAEDAIAVAEAEIGEVQSVHYKTVVKAVFASAARSVQSKTPSATSFQNNIVYLKHL